MASIFYEMVAENIDMADNGLFIGPQCCVREPMAQEPALLGMQCFVSLCDCVWHSMHHCKIAFAFLHVLTK